MKNLFRGFIIFLISFSLFLNFLPAKERDSFYRQLDTFAEALSIINKKYVEQKSSQDLIYGALRGLLNSLDPYSQFLTPDEYKDLLAETEGKFGGIGIEITIKEGLLTVISPIEDTPAWQAGIEAGDIIVKINGEITKDITLNQAVKKLRGEPGTAVNITLLKEKDRKLIEISLVRQIIQIKDIKVASILEEGIGYIKLLEFREKTPSELEKTLENLKKEGLRGLIIDLRNNPGGLLDSAVEVASFFLEKDRPIVSIKSRDGKDILYKSLPLKNKYLDIPLVVIVNKGSASASEIVASSLRENNRAIILGETTFGKGSVQTVVPLSDGSALRITTSKYFTPKGNSIAEKGFTPDILLAKDEKEKKEEEKEDIFEQMADKKDFDYKKDYQINRALDLVKGLLIVGKK